MVSRKKFIDRQINWKRAFSLLLCSALFASLSATPVFLGRRTVESLPDTVEIYAFKVEFAFEDPDNSLTTGRGVFDSDADTTHSNYSLDPQGARRTNSYWQKQLDFISHWFRTISRGKVIVTGKVFPENGGTYQLSQQMIDYNRTTKRTDEKTAQFDSSKVVDYLRFARDAIHAAAKSNDSPFKEPLPQGGRTHRLFMAIHAGANRLLDGGTMGVRYANTPGDFTDMMIDRTSFGWLRDIDSARGDTLGIVLQGMGVDTVTSLMVISETSSQDGLNWGIQGSAVHQVARALGLPIAYDAVKGISRTGWFDMLDFAGYSSANGFLPVYPNPWARVFMGWDEVTEARAGSDGTATYKLKAVSDTTPGGVRILKVPLTSGEYLLIENRQKSSDPSGKVTIKTDKIERTLPVDSLHQIFLDSLCDTSGKNCKPNNKKAKGIMQSSTSYDAGLPSSGIAVWKVSDWYIDRVLRYGYINATQEGSLSDHYLGVQLLEADGVLTIGRAFKDAYGNDLYDYGSGSDLLPHISYTKEKRDTVVAITPYSYANTNSSNNGLTHLSLSVALPSNARKEKGLSSFSGDSLINFAAPELEVTIDWRGLQIAQNHFPRRVAPNSAQENLLLTPHPQRAGEFALIVSGDLGHLQLFNSRGEALVSQSDSIPFRASYDSVTTLLDDPTLGQFDQLPLYAIGKPKGKAIGNVAWGKTIVSLHQNEKERTLQFSSFDSTTSEGLDRWSSKTLPSSISIGPIVWEDALWGADRDSLWRWETPATTPTRWSWPSGFKPHALAGVAQRDGIGKSGVVAIGDSGVVAFAAADSPPRLIATPLTGRMNSELREQIWRIVVADFLRVGHDQLFAVGSYGTTFMVDLKNGELLQPPRTYARGRSGSSSALLPPLYHDTTALAVADLDSDGYPEVVFTGHNTLYALDRHNTALPGFPFRYQSPLLEGHLLETPYRPGEIHSAPLLADVTGDGKPEILSATPAGLLYAVTHTGKLVQSPIGATLVEQPSGALRRSSDWPLAVGSLSMGDTARHPWIQLAAANGAGGNGELYLYALSCDHLFGWKLPQSLQSSNSWLAEGGGSGRSNWFDVSALEATSANRSDQILKFHPYPSPFRGKRGNFFIELGDDARSARIRMIDINGSIAFDQEWDGLHAGVNRLENISFPSIGSDIYSILLEVEFISGKRAKKWSRVGLIR